MLEFYNVSKSFWTGKTRKVILDQANFQVELGRSMGILAPNGTGKTTIINMMAGLEKPDEGKIIRTSKISFPLGVGAAIYLEEYAPRTWLTRVIETNIANLAGVPSIVYGMLGLTICYDIRFPALFDALGRAQCDIIAIPAALAICGAFT